MTQNRANTAGICNTIALGEGAQCVFLEERPSASASSGDAALGLGWSVTFLGWATTASARFASGALHARGSPSAPLRGNSRGEIYHLRGHGPAHRKCRLYHLMISAGNRSGSPSMGRYLITIYVLSDLIGYDLRSDRYSITAALDCLS